MHNVLMTIVHIQKGTWFSSLYTTLTSFPAALPLIKPQHRYIPVRWVTQGLIMH